MFEYLLLIAIIILILYKKTTKSHSNQPNSPQKYDPFNKPFHIRSLIYNRIYPQEYEDMWSEKSIKISHKNYNPDRYIVSIPIDLFSQKEKIDLISDICRELQLPVNIKDQELIPLLKNTNMIVIGTASSKESNKISYRIYLCFKNLDSKKNPNLDYIALDFTKDKPSKYKIRYYSNYKKTFPEIYQEIDSFLSPTYASIVKNIIDIIKTKNRGPPYYLQVNEKNTIRNSIDLNLLPFKVRIKDLPFSSIIKHFEIPNFTHQLNSNAIVTHISYGKNNKNQEFMTLYYDNTNHPPMSF